MHICNDDAELWAARIVAAVVLDCERQRWHAPLDPDRREVAPGWTLDEILAREG